MTDIAAALAAEWDATAAKLDDAADRTASELAGIQMLARAQAHADLAQALRTAFTTTEIRCYAEDLKPGDVIVAIEQGAGPWFNYTIRRATANLDGSERMYGGLDYFDAKAENDAAADIDG